MKTLREEVMVFTAAGRLRGTLFVGADGLPKLAVESDEKCTYTGPLYYTPTTLPAVWTVCWRSGNETDVLFDAWESVMNSRNQIAEAQREAEQETEEKREHEAS